MTAPCNIHISDQDARKQALNPQQSFIVQAPAGSGKTELLTQRYLSLLGHASKQPEDIIALTFTRKASAEMRSRIITSLQLGLSPEAPSEEHKIVTWQLAQQVLMKDEQQQWHLLENPQRLRIMTIDSFCGSVANNLPITTQLGGLAAVSDQPQLIYQHAIRKCLADLQQDNIGSKHLQSILIHLNNNSQQLEQLLSHLLSCREQWLSHVISVNNNDNFSDWFTKQWNQMKSYLCQTARSSLNTSQQASLLHCIRYAIDQFEEIDPSHPLLQYKNIQQLPQCSENNYTFWHIVSQLLLTNSGCWRRSITKKQGFPTQSFNKIYNKDEVKHYKQLILNLIKELSTSNCISCWQTLQINLVTELDNQKHIESLCYILLKLWRLPKLGFYILSAG